MKLVSFLTNANESYSKDIELIISIKDLSRFGTLELSELENIDPSKYILEWDILMTETDFSATIETVKKLDLNKFKAIRVQDPGALQYVLDNSRVPVQFIAETGNHNLKGLKKWKEYIGDRLDRLVLSIELPKDKLKEYVKELNCSIEIYGIGRVLLFYSPRKLLSADLKKQKIINHPIEICASSEESPHKGFPIVQNQHGTFMLNTKDHSLIDHVEELKEIGITHFRVDGRFFDNLGLCEKIESFLNKKIDVNEVKEFYPNRLIKGFFNVNKSDVIFHKLKNHRIQRKDNNHLGEVIDARKKKFVALLVKSNELNVGDEISLHTPDGKKVDHKVNVIRNSKGEEINSAKIGDLVYLKSINSVSVRSQVYLN